MNSAQCNEIESDQDKGTAVKAPLFSVLSPQSLTYSGIKLCAEFLITYKYSLNIWLKYSVSYEVPIIRVEVCIGEHHHV